MTVTISTFWIIILIIMIHTIFQHLINWGWRELGKDEEDIVVMFIATVFEFFSVIVLLALVLH